MGAGLDTKGDIGKPGADDGESGDAVSTTPTTSLDHSLTGNNGKVNVRLDNIDGHELEAGALDNEFEAWIIQLKLGGGSQMLKKNAEQGKVIPFCTRQVRAMWCALCGGEKPFLVILPMRSWVRVRVRVTVNGEVSPC